MQPISFIREKVVQSINNGSTVGLKLMKTIYLLKEAETEIKIQVTERKASRLNGDAL